jgi:hypothetical protein
MRKDESSWDAPIATGEAPSAPVGTGDTAPRAPASTSTKTSTERGSAADKALLDAGGAIVSRLRLRPIAARALTLLMEREGDVYGKQRAAIERALIDAAGGAEVLELLLAQEKAEAEAAEAAAAQAAAAEAAAAEAAAAELAEAQNRCRLSPIENDLVALLEKGPILGAAEVGHQLWPDREMQPQGAACAVNGILRRLVERGYVEATQVEDRRSYAVTAAGRDAREQDRLDAIDPRQLTLLDA